MTALLTTMFGVGGTLFKTARTINNDGKVRGAVFSSIQVIAHQEMLSYKIS
jgi:hypothetical protein